MTSAFDGSWSTTEANAAFASRASDFAIAAAVRISSAVSGSSECAQATPQTMGTHAISAAKQEMCRRMSPHRSRTKMNLRLGGAQHATECRRQDGDSSAWDLANPHTAQRQRSPAEVGSGSRRQARGTGADDLNGAAVGTALV